MKKHIAVLALAVSLSTPSFADPGIDGFTSYYAFGDSLTDQGQLGALAPPSEDGRFSNGPTYAEFLAQRFQDVALDTGNLAIGGATAGPVNANPLAPLSTFGGQVQTFIGSILGGTGLPEQIAPTPVFADAPPNPGSNPLVSVLFGANDIFQQLPNALATSLSDLTLLPGKITDIATSAAQAVATNIAALNAFDAKFNDFAVINLPDISNSPAFGDWGKAGAQAQLDALLAIDPSTAPDPAQLAADIQAATFAVGYLNALVPDPDQGGALVPLAQLASFEFNEQLSLALDTLDPSINIFEFDQPTFTEQFLSTSLAAGLIQDVPCTPSLADLTFVGNCAFDPKSGTFDNSLADVYYFADSVHPTAPVQLAFGQALLQGLAQTENLNGTVPAVPLPAGLPLLMAGMGAFASMRRRQQAA